MAINAHKTIVVHEVLDTVGYHGELSDMFFHWTHRLWYVMDQFCMYPHSATHNN